MLDSLERYSRYLVVAAGLLLVAALASVFLQRGGEKSIAFQGGSDLPPGTPIRVHVAGEVARPGVYDLVEGERVIDAIDHAGGATFSGDTNAINLARKLRDGEQIIVPARGGVRNTTATSAPPLAPGELINVNTATEAQLEQLPGIGEAYARRIVDSRTVDGPFKTLDELVTRKALPAATLEKVRDRLTVAP
jgi:competence protein ComEA